jgi:phage-related minor tail protein
MNIINDTLQNIRGVLYNIKKEAFKDLAAVFQQIFNIYIKIGNIFHVMIKHLVSILEIFKGSVNVGAAITSLLIDFINLIRDPINGLDDLISFFTR